MWCSSKHLDLEISKPEFNNSPNSLEGFGPPFPSICMGNFQLDGYRRCSLRIASQLSQCPLWPTLTHSHHQMPFSPLQSLCGSFHTWHQQGCLQQHQYIQASAYLFNSLSLHGNHITSFQPLKLRSALAPFVHSSRTFHPTGTKLHTRGDLCSSIKLPNQTHYLREAPHFLQSKISPT